MIYSRYGTRTIMYYRGLIQIYPIYVVILWFFTMANSAVPGTSGFIGEFMSLYGIFTSNPWIGFWSSLSII
jgi:NADH-quinone oxidoreductase subunit M